MRISDWSSDVCSSDLPSSVNNQEASLIQLLEPDRSAITCRSQAVDDAVVLVLDVTVEQPSLAKLAEPLLQEVEVIRDQVEPAVDDRLNPRESDRRLPRSEEHTSELQSLMRISYAVFC